MRKMKDSGIEWIGEIPHDWKIAKVKNIYSFQTGWTPSTSNATYFDGSIPWANISDIGKQRVIYDTAKHITEEAIENSSMEISPKGSLMYSFKLSVGDVSFCGVDMYTNEAIATFLPSERYDLRYLYYAAPFFIIKNANENIYGAKLLNQDLIKNALILDIPYHDQVAISDYLDKKCAEINALIAAKEKSNALLKERRQSIIYEAVTKGLNPDAPMKDSGIEWIGEIPKDWDVFPMKYLLDKNHPYPIGDGDHGMIKADDYLSEGIPYVRVLNLTWGDGLNLETLVYISEEMNNRIKNSELKPNDILIAKTGATIGKTAIVPESLPRSNTTSHVGKITISNDHDPKFFYYVMTSSVIQTQIQVLSAMQSTRPELGIDGLKNLLAVVPPVENQRKIATYLDHQCAELNSAIAINASMIEKLKEYRQSIIYEAVTGKIEI